MRIVVINTGPSFTELYGKFEQAAERGLDQCAQGAEKDFQAFTAAWSHQPAIETIKEPMQRTVGSDDQILDWVSNGTPAHPIPDVLGRKLRFAKNVISKTYPGRIQSEPGSRDNYVIAASVVHPGIEPRFVDDAIADKWDAGLAAETIQAEINKV